MTSKTPIIDSFIKQHKPNPVKDTPATKEEEQEARKKLVEIAEKFGGKK